MGYVGHVKSPTYTLCEPYFLILGSSDKKTSLMAHHFDLYRMRSPLEWQEAGFAEYFYMPGFCLIEWPEKADGTLPKLDIQIQLAASKKEEARDIAIRANSAKGASILTMLVSSTL